MSNSTDINDYQVFEKVVELELNSNLNITSKSIASSSGISTQKCVSLPEKLEEHDLVKSKECDDGIVWHPTNFLPMLLLPISLQYRMLKEDMLINNEQR